MSRPVHLSLRLALSSALFFTVHAVSPVLVAAQDTPSDAEFAGRSRGGYGWGEAPPEESPAPSAPPYHRYGTVHASLGFGGTVRILAHADVCNPDQPGREGCRFSPPYLQLRGGWFFEGDGDFQHGVALGIATNLTPDGTTALGIDGGGQWALTPTYMLRWWLDPWFQLMGQVGVPLAFSAVTGTTIPARTEFNWGLELQIGAVVKFLTGLGVYAAGNLGMYFAGDSKVWPTLSGEIGLVFDYEVLP